MLSKSFVLSTLMGLVLVIHSLPVSAQTDITPGEARAIAKDAYIYGFPLVEGYKTLYKQAVDASDPDFKVKT